MAKTILNSFQRKALQGFAIPLILISLVFVVFSLGAIFYFQRSSGSIISEKPTPSVVITGHAKQNIDQFITYQIPPRWTKTHEGQLESGATYMRISSPDLERSESGYIIKGASIYVERRQKATSESLTEYILNYLPQSNDINEVSKVKIGGLEGVSRFTAWEGYFLGYVIEKGGSLFRINFECSQSCSSKVAMDKTIYAKDRDLFLNSIQFK